MQYNSETNNQDIFSDARWWCGIANDDTTTFTLAEFTRGANQAMDRVTLLIMRADGRWKWDDANNADLPIATINLVADQEDYSIAVTDLKMRKVRIRDQQGNWVTLDPANRRDFSDSRLTEPSGDPKRYFKIGRSIFLKPTPSYSRTAGLEIQTQRAGNYFTIASTTAVPGFDSTFHRLISLYPALDYCETNDLDRRAKKIQARIDKKEADLIEFFSSRDMDEKQSIVLAKDDYGELALGHDGRFNSNPDGFNSLL